jgi:hypothetical protein
MSDVRPPITAGPIERAFKFLKSTSLSCGAVGDGAGVTLEDSGGVVLTGDPLGEVPLTDAAGGGVSSCACRIEALQIETDETTRRSRVAMIVHFSQRLKLGDGGNSIFCSSTLVSV